MMAGVLGKPLAPLLAALGLKPLAAAARLAPLRAPGAMTEAGVYRAPAVRAEARVALLRRLRQRGAGAADHAGRRSALLNRHGVEVVVAPEAGCCGSLEHHIGREAGALRQGARQRRRLDPRDRRRGARRHPHHHLGLRHHGEGLWLHAAHRSGLCGEGGQGVGARPRHLGISRRARPRAAGQAAQPHSGLSLRVLAAARPEGASGTARTCSRPVASW